jgi:vancomycin permeability regulator SanA
MKIKILKVFIILCVIGTIFVFGINYYILYLNKTTAVTIAEVPTTTIAMVFGGGMKVDGSMSDMQADRVKVGVTLYKLGKVKKLLMTGDDGRIHGDEVDAMRLYVIANGVSSTDVLVDPHGYRTYESCYREAKVYGVTKAVVISQAFHLPRIIYLCSHQGIVVSGVPADLRDYGYDDWYMQIREMGARVKAWWQNEITHPLPQSLEK